MLKRLFRKTNNQSSVTSSVTDLSWLNADMHSHVLPGIDDGSPDLETSIALVRELAALGYKKLIATPHIMWDVYPNTPEIINQSRDLLNNALKEARIDVTIEAAAEYYLDAHFYEQLEEKRLLTFGDNYVLVEMSFHTPTMNFEELIFNIQMAGYKPVLAHPERYNFLHSKFDLYKHYKSIGCILQLNANSLTGYYGDKVKETAQRLLKEDLISFIGTDLHHDRHLRALKKLSSVPEWDKYLVKRKFLNTTI